MKIRDVDPKLVEQALKEIERRRAHPELPAAAAKPAFGMPNLQQKQAGGGGGRGGPGGMGFPQQFFAFNNRLPVVEPMLVREYAHVRPPDMSPGERKDFVDTVYWHPALVLPNGKLDIEFQLSDAVTTYQLLVFGHTADGRIGSLTKTIEARLPFTLEPKLPLEVTAGDRIDMPVSVANNTAESRSVRMQLETANMKLLDQAAQGASASANLDLAADARGRAIFSMQPALVEGEAQIVLEGFSAPFRDRVIRRVPVVAQGFPVVEARSDFLEKTARQELVLPKAWIPGTLKCQVQVFPSTLASCRRGLKVCSANPTAASSKRRRPIIPMC